MSLVRRRLSPRQCRRNVIDSFRVYLMGIGRHTSHVFSGRPGPHFQRPSKRYYIQQLNEKPSAVCGWASTVLTSLFFGVFC